MSVPTSWDGWDRPPVLWTAHFHQSRVAPARCLPSDLSSVALAKGEALAKGGGKAEQSVSNTPVLLLARSTSFPQGECLLADGFLSGFS